tara:strand:+ start:61822 stop:62253 length:432 start_codon:yes stop_codon:yes gene_type:complete
MFNKQKKPGKVNNNASGTPSLNMISEDTKLKGTLNSQADLRIAGQIDGEIVCKGKVIITSSAKIDGNITSIDADIAGQVLGTVKISNKLIVRKTAKIRGDLYTKTLTVEEGASLNGGCRMGNMEKLENTGNSDFANNRRAENI